MRQGNCLPPSYSGLANGSGIPKVSVRQVQQLLPAGIHHMSPNHPPGFEKAPERPEFRRRPAWDRLRHRPSILIVLSLVGLGALAFGLWKATVGSRQRAGDTRIVTSMAAIVAAPEFEATVVEPLRQYLLRNLPLGIRREHLAAQIARAARNEPTVATRAPEPRKLSPPLDRWADLLNSVQADGIEVYGLVYRLRERRQWLHGFIVARLREAEQRPGSHALLAPLFDGTKPDTVALNTPAMTLAEGAVLRSLGVTAEELAAILFLADCCEQIRDTTARQ